MTLTTTSCLNSPPICIMPKDFADYLSCQQRYCLFLDIDGTLAEFTVDPKESVIPSSTLTILQDISSCGIAITAVTGRSLNEARQMLSPLQIPIAATHGLEIAFDGTTDNNKKSTAVDIGQLLAIKKSVTQSCLHFHGLTIETKPYSIALHYRQNPSLKDIAYDIMEEVLKNSPNWQLKQGKYVWELVPKGADKGTAILTLLKKIPDSAMICPIFIGDDITDEAGFIAVQNNYNFIDEVNTDKAVKGIGIKVGNEASCADFYVNDIQEVTLLLKSFLSFCQKQNDLFDDIQHADYTNTNADLNKNARPII